MHDFLTEMLRKRVERIESVKAGSLSGIAAGMSYCLIMTVDRFVLGGSTRLIVSLGLELAISVISGFLFGVTYRYIIRTDRNDHLNSGAVLAFGLVRGLAQIDVDKFQLAQIWMDGLILGKSILLFSIARYTLDYALAVGWILPFAGQSQDLSLDRIKTSEDSPKHTAEILNSGSNQELIQRKLGEGGCT